MSIKQPSLTKSILWLDDQLAPHQAGQIEKYKSIFIDNGLNLLTATDIDSFAIHLKGSVFNGQTTLSALVIDLMLPHMPISSNFALLGKPKFPINTHIAGASLLQLMRAERYELHRKQFQNGLLQIFENLPVCLLTSSSEAQQDLDQVGVSDATCVWKDAGDVESQLKNWIYKWS